MGTVQRDSQIKLSVKNLSDICFKYSFSNTKPCSWLHSPYKNTIPTCSQYIYSDFSKTTQKPPTILLVREKPGLERKIPPWSLSMPSLPAPATRQSFLVQSQWDDCYIIKHFILKCFLFFFFFPTHVSYV